MIFLRTVFFYIIVVLSYIIGSSITFICCFFCKDKIRPFQIAARIWSKCLLFCAGINVDVIGAKNVPKKEPLIYVSNHQGSPDILIFLANLPALFRFIIKKELFKIPLFGWYLRKAGYISVERGVGHKAHGFFSKAIKVLRSGENLLVFPEGTRTRTGKLGSFKRGSLLLAFKAKVRVVPVAISGSYFIQPHGSLLIKPTRVKVSIGKPVSLEKYGTKYEKALEDIRSTIEEMLGQPG